MSRVEIPLTRKGCLSTGPVVVLLFVGSLLVDAQGDGETGSERGTVT